MELNVLSPQPTDVSAQLDLEDVETADAIESESGASFNCSEQTSAKNADKQHSSTSSDGAKRSKRPCQSDVLNEISGILKFNRSNNVPSNDVDDVFGKMVAPDLKQLAEEKKCHAKHKIKCIKALNAAFCDHKTLQHHQLRFFLRFTTCNIFKASSFQLCLRFRLFVFVC